jgi:hypothetical protein
LGEAKADAPAQPAAEAASNAAREQFAETMLGVPAPDLDGQASPDQESPPVPAQRTYATSSPVDESRALMTSGPLGAREVHSSEWDSPDTLPRPAAATTESGPTPELRVAHLLRRLRRTIPLYAPLPESIRKVIDSDQSH